jgi:hypothetical protein
MSDDARDLVVPGGGLQGSMPLDEVHRDFVLLTVYVLASHGKIDKATDLAEGLLVYGGSEAETVFAAAVLDFAGGRIVSCRDRLMELDSLEPIGARRRGRYGRERERARLYLRARCAQDLNLPEESAAAIEAYLAAAPDGSMEDS